MYTVAFYSQRGGVGRTTALVNVAMELAHRGRKVMVVDFDLQSPDLTNFQGLRPPSPSLPTTEEVRPETEFVEEEESAPVKDELHAGLVEYVRDYLDKGYYPAVNEYLYQTAPVGKKKGQIWVMSAGRGNADYWQSLAEINWENLYDLHKGKEFFDYTKRQWQEHVAPDYVLIDTHAGITDTLGIATRQLAEAVVFLFVPDSLDREALHRVCAEVHAEADGFGPHRIRVYFAASKMPAEDDENRTLQHRLMCFHETDDGWIFDLVARIPFSEQLLSEKQTLIRTRPHSRLAREYRSLVNALIEGNAAQDREGARIFLADLQRNPASAVETGREWVWRGGAWQLNQIIEKCSDADTLSQAAACLFLAKRLEQALETLDRALEIRPNDRRLWWQRASYNRALGNNKQAVADLLKLLDTANPRPSVEETKKTSAQAEKSLTIDELLASLAKPRENLKFDFDHLFELNLRFRDTSDKLDKSAEDLPGVDHYIVSAMRRLRELSPTDFELAKQKPCIQSLPPEDQARLFAHREDSAFGEVDPIFLISSRQWDQAITSLTALVKNLATADRHDLFHLAMAYWGAGNEEKTAAIGKLAIDEFVKSWTSIGATATFTEPQMLSLLYWKLGDKAKSKMVLDSISEQLNYLSEGEPLFSCWRYKVVSQRQFAEDCHEQLLMINKVKIRPPFLGKVARVVDRGHLFGTKKGVK